MASSKDFGGGGGGGGGGEIVVGISMGRLRKTTKNLIRISFPSHSTLHNFCSRNRIIK